MPAPTAVPRPSLPAVFDTLNRLVSVDVLLIDEMGWHGGRAAASRPLGVDRAVTFGSGCEAPGTSPGT